jgi:hypothetical protein
MHELQLLNGEVSILATHDEANNYPFAQELQNARIIEHHEDKQNRHGYIYTSALRLT